MSVNDSPNSAESGAYPLEGWVAMKADEHRLDKDRIGCSCGFSVWSGAHVAVMAYREAVESAPREDDRCRNCGATAQHHEVVCSHCMYRWPQ